MRRWWWWWWSWLASLQLADLPRAAPYPPGQPRVDRAESVRHRSDSGCGSSLLFLRTRICGNFRHDVPPHRRLDQVRPQGAARVLCAVGRRPGTTTRQGLALHVRLPSSHSGWDAWLLPLFPHTRPLKESADSSLTSANISADSRSKLQGGAKNHSSYKLISEELCGNMDTPASLLARQLDDDDHPLPTAYAAQSDQIGGILKTMHDEVHSEDQFAKRAATFKELGLNRGVHPWYH